MTHQRAAALPAIALAGLLCAGSVASAAGSEPPADRGDARSLRSCIDASSTWSWTPYDDHTILVRSAGRAFKVVTNRCPRLADPLPIIVTKILGGSQICGPHDVQLMVGDSADRNPTPCFVQSITPLTAEEAKAIEATRRH
jgi:hypothetical protein